MVLADRPPNGRYTILEHLGLRGDTLRRHLGRVMLWVDSIPSPAPLRRPTAHGQAKSEDILTVEVGTLWRQRSVMGMLVRRDLAVKYQSSMLGYLWSLIDPLVQALIYWFIFGVLYHRSGDENMLGHAGYPLFIVSGIFAWMWMSAGITESAHALSSQSRLITTMRVHRQIFPISKVFARSVEFLVGIPVVLVFALIFHGYFTWRLLAIPLAMLIQGVLLIGVALILAPLNVLFRDVERMTRLIVRILMYSAPVIYPLARVLGAPGDPSRLPGWFQFLYQCNPLVGIMELQHGAWIAPMFPSAQLVIMSATGSLIVFILGWWVFNRAESAVLKEL
jgi:ABC-2 type transport system permease protein